MSGGPGRAVDLTGGALLKPLVVLSAPIVPTNLLQVGYDLADTFWVGRLGQAAVSALSFSWALVFLTISLAGGFAVAGTVLVAQNKGAGNADRVDHVAGQTLSFVGPLAVAFSVAGFVLAPDLLAVIGAEPGGRSSPGPSALGATPDPSLRRRPPRRRSWRGFVGSQ